MGERGQIFTVEDGVVVVEWYYFGDDVPYEFAVQLRFNATGQINLSSALGLEPKLDPQALSQTLRERFCNYWAVREFADAQGIPYEVRTDMQP